MENEGQTYLDLNTTINALAIKSGYKKYLLRTAQRAERFNGKAQGKKFNLYKRRELFMLRILKKQIVLFNLFSLISNQEKDTLVETVEYLADKN